ncbi:hypothetical protein G6F57_000117 [Rhizopus arrhizus]|nr:hypothetical protein G6F30_001784 [Rhizopus arrhizus]KAG0988978.1 hypothetical protein G6F29_001329 [Rhizopus arrhizus]KAG1030299.1 hypothetical protein G6F26_001011 [Rhizopus arrhizus]KAG1045426.1 hypothetical protein G6F25_000805 [Rhizopus arrhizus]KAG1288977.1 hypothetical protein G6F65_000456 [Rhizopus arrhizus]
MCNQLKKLDTEVCEGVIREQGPVIHKVITTMDIPGRDGQLICGAVIGSCPYPEVSEWNVPFPKPKPSENRSQEQIKSEGKTFTVLQLSDWHIDFDYLPGSEVNCNRPICCRAASTDNKNITKKASMWGEYTCDSSLGLIESLLRHIPKVEPNIRFSIFTGDIPPHDVWSTLPFGKTQFIQDQSYELFHSQFDSPLLINSNVFPTVGNHESAPANIFPLEHSNIPSKKAYLDLKWLYKSLATNWQSWLGPDINSFVQSNTGSYVARPVPGLKLISLNTNFCYILNWWLYQQPVQKDPNGILAWLVNALQDSEDRNERVWIIGHIPPGDGTCFHDYSNYYSQIIDRYSHIISAQFFGHTHKDEISLFYRSKQEKTAENAISVAYIGPSVTPLIDLNPGFRTYKVDTKTFEIVDSITYIADLDKFVDKDSEPNWHVEYSAREAYNSSRAQITSPTSPLSASWWHNVTVDMENNEATFNKYHLFTSKSSPIIKECDENCRKNTICGIRAGNSEHRCDHLVNIYGRERYIAEPHLCGIPLTRKA